MTHTINTPRNSDMDRLSICGIPLAVLKSQPSPVDVALIVGRYEPRLMAAFFAEFLNAIHERSPDGLWQKRVKTLAREMARTGAADDIEAARDLIKAFADALIEATENQEG